MSIVDAYKALADESRLRVLHLLGRSPLSVQDLTRILGLGQSTVSHHLKVLTQAQMIQAERSGTWIFYNLTPVIDHNVPLDSGAHLAQHFANELSKNLTNGLSEKFSVDKEELKKLLSEKRTATKNFFDAIAPNWKSLREELHTSESYFSEVQKRVFDQQSLLELGCGAGALLDTLLPRSGQTVAVDYSAPMLEAAKKNLGARANGVDLRLGYLEHLPLADDSVEVAVSYMVLHHIADPKRVFKDVFRCLSEGGSFIIVELEQNAVQNPDTKSSIAIDMPEVWNAFSKKDLKNWLLGAGFTVTEELCLSKHVFLITGSKPKTIRK